MRRNPLREKLRRGELVFGPCVLELASPGLAQIFENAGADFSCMTWRSAASASTT